MAGFIRIKQCCCCGGSVKGGAIAFGIFYLLLALAIASVIIGFNNGQYNSTSMVIYTPNFNKYGVCEENIFLPLLEISAILSVIVNLSLLYGAVTEQPSFIALWLGWHLAYPIVNVALIIWGIIALVTCKLPDELENTVIGILVCNGVSLAIVFYFAVLVYSLYKTLTEGVRNNVRYGTTMLLPSKNWDEALTPYTNYDSSAATPTAWGTLQPLQPAQPQPLQPPPMKKAPAPPPPPPLVRQKSGIPRPQA